MKSVADKHYLDWSTITDLVDRLVEQIRGREYDALLAITRDGMIPACLISEKLDMRNILVASVMFYSGIEKTLEKPIFMQFPADPYLKGSRILVVDDIWDSGKTAMAVRNRIIEVNGTPEVAVLHYKPSKSHFPGQRPDFAAAETDEWIVYPWEPDEQ